MSFREGLHTLALAVLQNSRENSMQGPRRDRNVAFAKDDRLRSRKNFSSDVCPRDVPE